MLTVFINESRDESIKDFIVNRNPEFALTIVHNPNEQEANAKVEQYLKETAALFKTLN